MANGLIGDPYAASNGLGNAIAQTAQVLFAPTNDADTQMKAFYYRTLADQQQAKAAEAAAQNAYGDIIGQGPGAGPQWINNAGAAAARAGVKGEDFGRMLAAVIGNTTGVTDAARYNARTSAGYPFANVDQGVSMQDLQDARRQFFGNKLAVQGLNNQGDLAVQALRNTGEVEKVQATPMTQAQVVGSILQQLAPHLSPSQLQAVTGVINQPSMDVYQTPAGQTVRVNKSDPNAAVLPTISLQEQPGGAAPAFGPMNLQPFPSADAAKPTSEMRNNDETAAQLGITTSELVLMQQVNNAVRSGLDVDRRVLKQVADIQNRIAMHASGIGSGAPPGSTIVQAPPPGSVPVQ